MYVYSQEQEGCTAHVCVQEPKPLADERLPPLQTGLECKQQYRKQPAAHGTAYTGTKSDDKQRGDVVGVRAALTDTM